MAQRVVVEKLDQTVAEFVGSLGKIREPIELVLRNKVVAKIISPGEMSDEEKQKALDDAWRFVQRVREKTRGIPASKIQKEVNAAVREVRAKHAHGGR